MKTFKSFLLEKVDDQLEDKVLSYITDYMKSNNEIQINADDIIYDSKIKSLFDDKRSSTIQNKVSAIIHSLIKKNKLVIVKKSESSSSDTTYSKFGHHKTGTIHTQSTSFIIKLGNK